MKYDIYLHDDFDGRASAAILGDFFRTRGDSVAKYVPVNFDVKKKWPRLKFARPTAIVDFIYHPKAAMWFDHHRTPFIKKEWKRSFRKSKNFQWDTTYASCCRQVLESLERNFGYRPPARLRALSRALDIVDGAQFRSARQTIMMKESYIKLDAFIDYEVKKKNKILWLIRDLREKSLADIVSQPSVNKVVRTVAKKRMESLKYYRANMAVNGRVGFMDLTRKDVLELRFAPFFLKPRLAYAITLKKGRKNLHMTVGVNPWARSRSRFDISKIMQEYGGGGHKNVGGAEIQSHARAVSVAHEIIKKLNG